MAVHWTYRDAGDVEGDLEQGDIIYPSAEIRDLFSDVHPHFSQDKYLAFMVASQTCDLVRRKGSPKAGYITLAAVRPLSKMLPKLISQVVSPVANGVFPKSGAEAARQLLERIFNQNEQSIGVFFLYPDADLKLGEEAVAMLRVTVSVKSMHYNMLADARVGRLQPAFQAKLGWLLGNLYNRPATKDWADVEGGKEKFSTMVRSFIEPAAIDSDVSKVVWLDDVLIDEARKKRIPIDDAALGDLESLRPRPSLERALEEVVKELAKVIPDVDALVLEKVQNRLKNNGKFKKLIAS